MCKYTNAVIIRAKFESIVAVTLITSSRIDAGSVLAHVLVALALVHVQAVVLLRSQGVAGPADALEGPLKVSTVSVGADARTLDALVNVHAIPQAKN